MRNYYDILGVSKDATEQQIKTAFKKGSLKYHPDRQNGKSDEEKAEAEEKFKEINEAYQCLSDPDKKMHYDIFGTMDNFDADSKYKSNAGPFGGGFDPFFGGFGGYSQPRPQAQPGSSVRMQIPVTIEELYKGLKKTIKFIRKIRCVACHGEGGTGVKMCPDCKGSGYVTISNRTPFGYMQESRPCNRCKGTGKIVSNTCKTCKGTGFREVVATLDIEFEPGIPEGMAIKFPGQGNESKSLNGASGDFIAIAVYDRQMDIVVKGLDVFQKLRIPYYDCLLGCEKEVKLPNDQIRKIRIPSCCPDGKKITLANDGLYYDHKKGNFYIIVEYEIPTVLTSKDRKLLAKIKLNNEPVEQPVDQNEPETNNG